MVIKILNEKDIRHESQNWLWWCNGYNYQRDKLGLLIDHKALSTLNSNSLACRIISLKQLESFLMYKSSTNIHKWAGQDLVNNFVFESNFYRTITV